LSERQECFQPQLHGGLPVQRPPTRCRLRPHQQIVERIRLAVQAKPDKHVFVEAPGKLVRIIAGTGG
jgi:hypothetical protein